MKVGKVIRTLRKQQGLNQRQLCKKAGIKQPTLCLIELKNRSCNPGTLKAIASALGTTPAVIFLASITVDDIPANRKVSFNDMKDTFNLLVEMLKPIKK